MPWMQDNQKQRPSLSLLTTVISSLHPSHVVIEAGFKAFGFECFVAVVTDLDFPGKENLALVP